MNKRTTIGQVFVDASLKKASRSLIGVLDKAYIYDSADRLFLELRTLGFSPSEVSMDDGTASAVIVDPNIGRVRICCHHVRVSVH